MSSDVASNAPIGLPSSPSKPNIDRSSRRKAFKAGVISYQNHSLSNDCIIRDMSDTGAKLRFEKRTIVPDKFTLIIPVDGKKVDCQVRWRNDIELGVEFVSEIQSDKRIVRDQKIDVRFVVPRKTSLRKR